MQMGGGEKRTRLGSLYSPPLNSVTPYLLLFPPIFSSHDSFLHASAITTAMQVKGAPHSSSGNPDQPLRKMGKMLFRLQWVESGIFLPPALTDGFPFPYPNV